MDYRGLPGLAETQVLLALHQNVRTYLYGNQMVPAATLTNLAADTGISEDSLRHALRRLELRRSVLSFPAMVHSRMRRVVFHYPTRAIVLARPAYSVEGIGEAWNHNFMGESSLIRGEIEGKTQCVKDFADAPTFMSGQHGVSRLRYGRQREPASMARTLQ